MQTAAASRAPARAACCSTARAPAVGSAQTALGELPVRVERLSWTRTRTRTLRSIACRARRQQRCAIRLSPPPAVCPRRARPAARVSRQP
jgi:hypothetical protein